MAEDRCHAAVRMAAGPAFSDEEIDSLIDRLADRARRQAKAEPTASERDVIAKAATAITKEELMAALMERRLRAAAAAATERRRARLAAMPADMSPLEKLRAFVTGDERLGHGTGFSIDAEGRARQMAFWGQVELGLKQMPGLIDRLSNPYGFAEAGFDRKVATELVRLQGMPGLEPTGDEGALHAARVFAKALNDARSAQNAEGAFIGKQDGYIVRQSHSAEKIGAGFFKVLSEFAGRAKEGGGFDKAAWRAAVESAERRAFGAWRDHILPLLDPKTFDGLTEADAPFQRFDGATDELAARGVLRDPSDVRERMLHSIWLNIVTGQHAELHGASDLGEFRPPASRARLVSQARVLHFRSPDAWVDYNVKYGNGPLYAAIMKQLERAGRNAALMHNLGPSPEAAYDAEAQRLMDEARAAGKVSHINQLKTAIGNGLARAEFEQVNGTADIPVNVRLASVMRGIRGWEALTKLGGITLSKTTDAPLTALTFVRAGAGWLAGFRALFDGFSRLGPAEQKQAADMLYVGARSFAGHMGSQYTATDGIRGYMAWANRLMYRANLFEFFNNNVRRGAAEGVAKYFGDLAQNGWQQLPQGARETFDRFGIAPGDWEAVRRSIPLADDGKRYFTFDHVDRAIAAGADGELKLKFMTLVHDWLDNTVSEPRARERAALTMGTKPGTPAGEFLRSFWEFKGFISAVLGRHLVPAKSGYAGYSPISLVGSMVLGCTLAGWVSMNAKAIVRGENPKPLVGATLAETTKIWMGALAQGGGLGIYGDWLFGEQNRNGLDFSMSGLGGPILSDGDQLGKILVGAINGGNINPNTGRSAIPGEAVKLASRNIPLINVFYSRLALDYLILWRLQEAASPGYLQRYERNVRQKEGQDFWLPPTSVLN